MTTSQTPAPLPSHPRGGGGAGTTLDRGRIGNRTGARRRPNYSSFDELVADSTRVDEAGCWIWTKKLSKKGYGQIHATRDRPMGQAHRFVWENMRGPIPDGLQLDHLCRVKACVNPDHLEPVTPAENTRRAMAAREPKETCPRGHSTAEFRARVPSGGWRCRRCDSDRGRQRRARARAATS